VTDTWKSLHVWRSCRQTFNDLLLSHHARRRMHVKTRRHSVVCIPLPRHIQIGTVSLPASSRYIYPPRFSALRRNSYFQFHFHLHISRLLSAILIVTFQNLINSSLFHRLLSIPRISRESTHDFLSHPAQNRQTDKQTNKRRCTQYLRQKWRRQWITAHKPICVSVLV